MSENNQSLDLGSMLEETLDAIPDAPDFVTPPPGEYTLEVKECKIEKYKTKPTDGTAAEEKQRLRATYAVVSTASVQNGEQPVPDGSLFSETFMGTEQGLGYFKARLKSILNISDVAGVTLKDMMDSVKGQNFNCRLTIKKSPNPKGGEYENVQIRVLPPAA